MTARLALFVAALALVATENGSAQENGSRAQRAQLDALGAYPGTTLIGEYVRANGLGRQYASPLPVEKAVDVITNFYEARLLKSGWTVLDRHAAITSYQKGDQIFAVLRAGPENPGLTADDVRIIRTAATPKDARFFFEIEIGPKVP